MLYAYFVLCFTRLPSQTIWLHSQALSQGDPCGSVEISSGSEFSVMNACAVVAGRWQGYSFRDLMHARRFGNSHHTWISRTCEEKRKKHTSPCVAYHSPPPTRSPSHQRAGQRSRRRGGEACDSVSYVAGHGSRNVRVRIIKKQLRKVGDLIEHACACACEKGTIDRSRTNNLVYFNCNQATEMLTWDSGVGATTWSVQPASLD